MQLLVVHVQDAVAKQLVELRDLEVLELDQDLDKREATIAAATKLEFRAHLYPVLLKTAARHRQFMSRLHSRVQAPFGAPAKNGQQTSSFQLRFRALAGKCSG